MKKIKKFAASLMAVAAMATCMGGMSASALTPAHIVADNNSEFAWDLSKPTAVARLKNTTVSDRYGSVYIYGYDSDGNYAGSLSKTGIVSPYNGVSSNALLKEGSLRNTVASASFSASLYTTTTPYGTPMSSWYKTHN